MSCVTTTCGLGGWNGPLPGDPDNNITLSATTVFSGIRVNWSYPSTNSHAVAHTILYRGVTAEFAQAMEIAKVGGSSHLDVLNPVVETTYYYWIRMVSSNGTVANPIGPASAVARPRHLDTLEDITARIDESALAQALKTEIGKITLNYQELVDEIHNRLAGNTAITEAMAQIESGLVQALAFVDQEITSRIDGQNALVTSVNTVAALNAENMAALVTEQAARVTADSALAIEVGTIAAVTNNNAAAILTEQSARATADNSLALSISTLATADATNAAAVVNIETAKIGYSALNDALSTPYDGDGTTIIYSEASYPATNFPEYAFNRKRIVDKVGVTNWNATSAGQAKPLIWIKGMPLASAIKRVGVTGPNGENASLETAFTAQQALNGQFKAQYTAKVNVNGLIGGFGIYNNGVVVDAGFDVDEFWIGRTNADKVKPFTISGGTVHIDAARIRDADITSAKIRDAAITNAKIGTAAVNTLSIAGEAVTIPRGAYATDTVFAVGTDVLTLPPMTTLGGAVILNMYARAVPFTGEGAPPQAVIAIYRNGTLIFYTFLSDGYTNTTSGTCIDSPPAGTYTYTLRLNGTISERALTAIGCKR